MPTANDVTDLSYQVIGPELDWLAVLPGQYLRTPSDLTATAGWETSEAARAAVVASTRRYSGQRSAFVWIAATSGVATYSITMNGSAFSFDNSVTGFSSAAALVDHLQGLIDADADFETDAKVEGVGFWVRRADGTDLTVTAISNPHLSCALEVDSFTFSVYGQAVGADGTYAPGLRTWVSVLDAHNGPRQGKGADALSAAASSDVVNGVGQLHVVDVTKLGRIALVVPTASAAALPAGTAGAVIALFGVWVGLTRGLDNT